MESAMACKGRYLAGLALLILGSATLLQAAVIEPYGEIYALCNVQKFDNGTALADNVHAVLAQLVAAAASSSYSTSTRGTAGRDIVHGIFQCRGDVSADICHRCVSKAVDRALSGCERAVGSRVQLDTCFLRYETYSFMTLDSSIVTELCNTQKNESALFQSQVAAALQKVQCSDCLSAHPASWQDCDHAVGAQIHAVDCYYRYETYPFFYTS